MKPNHLRRLLFQSIVPLGLALWLASAQVARAGQIIHVVQPGENLFRIGLRYGVDWRTLMIFNGLVSTNIYVGEALIIPDAGGSAAPAAQPASAAPAPAPTTADGAYVIQPGDTLWKIAQRFQLTVSDLLNANGLANPNYIYYGQTLIIPSQAAPSGKVLAVTGRLQAWPLDCEARSAVDWAGYFGVGIGEADFVSQLPASDDPDSGFVGDVSGQLGQTPPASYGVYAGPIASLLRAYGVSARAASGLSWDALRAEIDANRPVMVWVVGQVWNGAAFDYTASNGHTTRVVPYEHTLLVIGYGSGTVTLLDGGTVYTRSLPQFIASWGVLGNMAVLAQ